MDAKRLKKYLFLTFLITWGCWWGEALLVHATALTESAVFPMILFTLGGFGPTIAAFLCNKGGRGGKRAKAFFFGSFGKNVPFVLAALILETAAFVLCSNGLNASVPRSPVAAVVLLAVFLQAAVLYGGNEEPGWRGTMHAILIKRFPYEITVLLTGAVWVVWHVPLWFIEGNSHQSMSFVFFAVLGLALSFWLAAVYERTDAVVPCMILHGWTNTLMGLFDIRANAAFYTVLAVLTVLSVSAVRLKHIKQNTTR